MDGSFYDKTHKTSKDIKQYLKAMGYQKQLFFSRSQEQKKIEGFNLSVRFVTSVELLLKTLKKGRERDLSLKTIAHLCSKVIFRKLRMFG